MAIRPSSSSSFSYRFSYDVFLSFRGDDTRYGFTGNLYNALHNRGIHTFIDHKELQRGNEITSRLEKAIQESRIFIIVLSQNYASSSFCLNELAYILNFIKGKGLLVLPVFHNIDPSHVRHHLGSIGAALANHEMKFNANKVAFKHNMRKLDKWKMALHQVANLSGYHFKHGDRYEYKLIKEIVELVSRKINRAPLHVADYPVGLESQVLKVMSLLDVDSDDVVRMMGIHGLGGVGKTSLAVAVYNSIADHFEGLCFLENVRETSNKHGLQHLQTILLSKTVGEKEIKLTSWREGIPIIKYRLQRKKVLLILDDVDKREQLQAIVGRPDWFGTGSRVIITTRDKQLLASHGIKRTYEVKELKKEHALQLLSWYAFNLEKDKVDSCYLDVLNRAVTYASGLPLALEVMGSNLFGKGIEQWKSALNRYERIPDKKIQEILKVSYDALEEDEQSVFLDIACFLKEYELAEVKDILYAHHGHCMQHHIGVLVEKSLVKIGWRGNLTLHDLIEDMGKEIVRNESTKQPGERSRLWFHTDIVEVLQENKGTSKIEVIFMNFPLFEEREVEVKWDGDAFKKMENLKTLIIRNGHFSKGPKHLPNSIRVLEWWRYPSRDLPYDFHPKKLAICKLPNSDFTSLGLASLFLKKEFVNLTSLNFDKCKYLTQIPDLSCLLQLEKLSFKWCWNLLTIHDSVGFLENLNILDATGCSKLKRIPAIKLTSLEQLNLECCISLDGFPEVLGKMENITELDLRGTPIKKIPLSFQNLSQLQHLVLGCVGMTTLRLSGCDAAIFIRSISMMPELTKITACDWSMEGWLFHKEDKHSLTVSSNVQHLFLRACNLSDDFFSKFLPWFANVKDLNLTENNITVIPEFIKECSLLTSLTLDRCYHLRDIRGIPPNLKYFSASECLSLTSSSRSMLLNQELHEAGNTDFYLPGAKLPKWFEFQTWGPSISFWFRNKFPALVICLVRESADDYSRPENSAKPYVYINGNKRLIDFHMWTKTDSTRLFDLQPKLKEKRLYEYNLDEALQGNEWNHIKITFGDWYSVPVLMKSGIHILKQKNSIEDIQFTDPCR